MSSPPPDAAPKTHDEGPPSPRPRRTTWIGTPEHFQWLELIVRALLVLNVIDAVMTVAWIYAGRATEANPLIADLAHSHPVLFVVVKTSLVSLGSLLLWRLRRQPLAVVAIFTAFLAYYFVLIYHLQALDLRLIQRIFG